MKATGITRRIDELGRIVIPKEIRKTMKIRVGTPLEIFISSAGELIMKKYSPVLELSDIASECAEAIFQATEIPNIIVDQDSVVAVAGLNKKDYINKTISGKLTKLIEKRTPSFSCQKSGGQLCEILNENNSSFGSQIVAPIVIDGDCLGAVILLSKNDKGALQENDIRIAHTTSLFLSKQF